MEKTRKKIKRLEENKKKIVKRIERIDKKFREQKGNEEMWPGHESTTVHDDLNEQMVLKAHLKGIEKELARLKEG
jgi:hypothetical protein